MQANEMYRLYQQLMRREKAEPYPYMEFVLTVLSMISRFEGCPVDDRLLRSIHSHIAYVHAYAAQAPELPDRNGADWIWFGHKDEHGRTLTSLLGS